MPLASGAAGLFGTVGTSALWPCLGGPALGIGGLDRPDAVPAHGIPDAEGRSALTMAPRGAIVSAAGLSPPGCRLPTAP